MTVNAAASPSPPKELEPLFRRRALDAQKTQWLGTIVLIRPLALGTLTAVASLMALAVVALLVFGSYTQHTTVSGQIMPSAGVMKVLAPQASVVARKQVVEGQLVQRGDVLFTLSNERLSLQGDTQALISQQIKSKQVSLQDELLQTQLLQKDERNAIAKKISLLSLDLEKITRQIQGQQLRVSLAQEAVPRYQSLLQQGYISKDQLQQRQEEQLEQHHRLLSLEREKIALARELDAQHSELAVLQGRQRNQLAQVERNLSSTAQDLSESEARRTLVITAPEAGVATAVMAEVGQSVDANRVLVSLVPQGAVMQVQLYAPSRAIGFIKPGDAVLVRYQAYPYQKFGHHEGRVAEISRTALSAAELAGLGVGAEGRDGAREPMYRITVALAAQQMQVRGESRPLQPGMALEAEIRQESRRLYEWVLEPVMSLRHNSNAAAAN